MTDSNDTTAGTDHWVTRRLPAWQQLDECLPALEDDKPIPAQLALDVVQQYPEIARDLAIAKRAAPAGRVAGYLEHIYARLHRVLFKAPRAPARERLAAFRDDVPGVVGELWRHIAVVTSWFLLTAAAGWWLVASYPELITLFASEQMIDTVGRGQLWTDDLLNVTPSSMLSIRIFTNNIAVALTALCLGLFYGLGTLYIIGLNGLMLGGVFAFTTQQGLGLRLFEFISAHGFVELTIICIAGAIGFYVGEALARPGHRSRIEALQRRVARTSSLMMLCVLYLVGAGLIEGYVSPNPSYPLSVRLTVGLAYFALFLFGLAGFRVRRVP
jgi:uncharacterized membrane protein SpoIIM required for sporulation